VSQILRITTKDISNSRTHIGSLIFAGLDQLPPANASNYIPWAIVGFIFQYIIRRRYFSFWAKYNCKPLAYRLCTRARLLKDLPCDEDVLSGALDAGTAVGVLAVYFMWVYCALILSYPALISDVHGTSLQYPRHNTIGQDTVQKWWGNTVFQHTADWKNMPLKTVPDGQTFGCVP